MLSMVKLLLKGEAGESWKNHGIVFLNFCEKPAIKSALSYMYMYEPVGGFSTNLHRCR